ncbi:MAG: SDR family NAD(P)-dependent oxidoreductase [Acidiferrobacterales bacterium]|nr:SDR family NAD(P)-dependent oxidoreductase [Acidiferrobacterales bacterium]
MKKKIALITGASAGIGRATAYSLANLRYDLILLSRREDKLLQIAAELAGVNTYIIACDINDYSELTKQLANLPAAFQDIDVLVNNAGLALGLEPANETEWRDWQTMIETNCLSLAFITRQILPTMVERNRGHIINIGSTAGSYQYKGGNVYGASKAFVDQFSMNLLTDLLGTKVRATLLAPGLLGDTEFSLVRFHGDQEKADKVYAGHQPLKPEDIAETIRWVLSQPEHVNINRIEIMPTCQAPAGLAVKS